MVAFIISKRCIVCVKSSETIIVSEKDSKIHLLY